MSMVDLLDGRSWAEPPPIFGPRVRARATLDLTLSASALPGLPEIKSPRRSRELAAGRLCAAQALRDAGSESIVVGIGRQREPLWPEGFVGSITHSASFACAAIARATDLIGLGIDSEPIFDDAAMHEAMPIALDPNERWLIDGACQRELATLIFSAKESFFKCLYPLTGVFFEFVDAHVEWIAPIEPSSGAFGVRLLRSLSANVRCGLRLEGRYAASHDHVHTALELLP